MVLQDRQRDDSRIGDRPGDEKSLIALCLAGDIQAFEQLILRYEKRVFAAAYRLCGDWQEGEDLTQETFIKAWRALAGYKGQASFGTWLTAILTNLWRDRMRKGRLSTDSLDETIEGDSGPIMKEVQDVKPGPDSLLEAKTVQETLGLLLMELKPEYKEAVILRDVQGFSYEEVAVITGSSLGTVKSRINRGRDQLKKRILNFQEQNPDFFRQSQTKGKGKAKANRAKGGKTREG